MGNASVFGVNAVEFAQSAVSPLYLWLIHVLRFSFPLFIVKVLSLLKLFNNNLWVTENLNLLFSFLSDIGLDMYIMNKQFRSQCVVASKISTLL